MPDFFLYPNTYSKAHAEMEKDLKVSIKGSAFGSYLVRLGSLRSKVGLRVSLVFTGKQTIFGAGALV